VLREDWTSVLRVQHLNRHQEKDDKEKIMFRVGTEMRDKQKG